MQEELRDELDVALPENLENRPHTALVSVFSEEQALQANAKLGAAGELDKSVDINDEMRPKTAVEEHNRAQLQTAVISNYKNWYDELQSSDTDSNMPVLARYQKHLTKTMGILGAVDKLKKRESEGFMESSSESDFFKSDKHATKDSDDIL